MTALANLDLVLASTSIYRRELLARLGAPFRQQSPQTDETALPGETPERLAVRLAAAKAHAVAAGNPNALVIGSDQVADCDGQVLGKPGDLDRARQQLRASSGRRVVFHTAVCLIDTRTETGREFAAIDTTTVVFRSLSNEEIETYLARELPFDCAGSFKSEGLGIALFERIESQDPSALIGLPMILLCRLLREAGVGVI
ncbi:MAG: septum formation inhibitor Maf [Rudaea sp.]|uniref:Maf family protein n=1 Tax=unclassified Rudaea TaxID=2627037 RepID=UPI0010F60ED6|nr:MULTISPECIES: Maf family nucleotide pyrophosphatase [unclassified Rudaea]MBN8884861.1 septum formation inhibitor Maf [Rudaea sp.]MBR0343658.1 septum formation inhibitor Maf [Rudaea sp.]